MKDTPEMIKKRAADLRRESESYNKAIGNKRTPMKPWLIRRKRLVTQAKDLQRQLLEAWDEYDSLDGAYDIVCEQVRREEENHKYTKEQLHRTARERDECYRQKRLSDIRRKKEEK